MADQNTGSGEISPVEVSPTVLPTSALRYRGVGDPNTVVSVDADTLASSMSNKLVKLSPSRKLTIFKIPDYIRCKRKALYDPQIISIGPYHHGAKSLEPMEEQKWRYLHQLLQTNSCSLADLVRHVTHLEAEARSAYEESVSLPKSDEFVKMMVLDACFIIQFLSNFDYRNVASDISAMLSDLLLLENQIPFFIIHNLYLRIFNVRKEEDLYSNLADFMFTAADFKKFNAPTKTPVHLVHLYYEWIMLIGAAYTERNFFRYNKSGQNPPVSMTPNCTDIIRLVTISFSTSSNIIQSRAVPGVKVTTTAPIKVIPSATTLQESGVKFKRRTSYGNLFLVTFEKGVIEISSVILDNNRKRLFLNLIALEQSQVEWKKDLTSFAKLMDMLIDTPKDVAILEKCGILYNLLASAEEATRFFNQICECAAVDYNNNYLDKFIEEVREFNDSKWHRRRAKLMHDYFNSPWSVISFIGGITLLTLTFLQLYFAIYPTH